MSARTPEAGEFALALLILGTAWFLISSEGHPWLALAILAGALTLAEQDATAAGVPGPIAELGAFVRSGTLTAPVAGALPGKEAK